MSNINKRICDICGKDITNTYYSFKKHKRKRITTHVDGIPWGPGMNQTLLVNMKVSKLDICDECFEKFRYFVLDNMS